MCGSWKPATYGSRGGGTEAELGDPMTADGEVLLHGDCYLGDILIHGDHVTVLAWLAEDYPELFGAADLRGRLWLYALAYTIRQIIFWPPDRAEADDLEITHPLHTLRRLIDAPLPLLAAGLS
jgi:hypothetical protein